MARVLLAILLGNALGYWAWHAGWAALPWLWGPGEASTDVLARAGAIALTAILMAAPPVLVGALGAWIARRAQLWVGIACGLWSLSLIQAEPDVYALTFGVWYAPTVLILLSSTLGGWMLDLRAQAKSQA
jgi:hypothetical protein